MVKTGSSWLITFYLPIRKRMVSYAPYPVFLNTKNIGIRYLPATGNYRYTENTASPSLETKHINFRLSVSNRQAVLISIVYLFSIISLEQLSHQFSRFFYALSSPTANKNRCSSLNSVMQLCIIFVPKMNYNQCTIA